MHKICLSEVGVHVLNRLLRENRKSISKFLSFKNVTLQILNFVPVS